MITVNDKARIIQDQINFINGRIDKINAVISLPVGEDEGQVTISAIEYYGIQKSELMLQIEALLNLKASLN
jgi:hypothetical protein